MIEAASISILAKAVDFLFDEGRKILQERRERRQAESHAEVQVPHEEEGPQPKRSAIYEASEKLRTKQETLRQEVSAKAWDMYHAQVKHEVALMDTYTKNYFLAKEQKAKWGSELVPPIVLHRLEEAEDNVSIAMEQLRSTLERIYGKSIVIPELEIGGES